MRRINAGIHVLVKKGDAFLVLMRSKNDLYDPECWDLPGGSVDFNEQPIETAVRETREEAGIEIKNVKVIHAWGMPTHNIWSVELIATADYDGGEIILGMEHTEYKWLSESELKSISPQSVHLKHLYQLL